MHGAWCIVHSGAPFVFDALGAATVARTAQASEAGTPAPSAVVINIQTINVGLFEISRMAFQIVYNFAAIAIRRIKCYSQYARVLVETQYFSRMPFSVLRRMASSIEKSIRCL